MGTNFSTRILPEIVAALSTAMSPRYLAVAVFIAAGLALLRKNSLRITSFIPVTLIIAQTITTILKYSINRQRPPIQDQLVYTYDPAFPSGHSSAAFAVATGVIILLITKNWQPKYPWAIGIVALMGASLSAASRLYLNVHWPTDVLAGTAIGVSTALTVWFAGSYVYRHRPRVR